MAKCRDCGQPIRWSSVGGRWYRRNFDGTDHVCMMLVGPETEIPPHDAFCAKCFKPVLGGRNVCECLSPAWVRRSEIPKLKQVAKRAERMKERVSAMEIRKIYKCLLCDGNAVKAGDSVYCLKDDDHVFAAELYPT